AALAIINSGARIIYTIGRDGLLPSWTARTHTRRSTPIAAITALCLFGLICGLPLGFIMTPIKAFDFLGTLDAIFILLIYVLYNVACLFSFLRKSRDQFQWFRHGIVPVLSTVLMFGIFVAAAISPGPTPLSFVPYVLCTWIVLGLGTLLLIRQKVVTR